MPSNEEIGSNIRIILCPHFMNLGGTMRAIEIAKAIVREAENLDISVDLVFCSVKGPPGSSFEPYVRDAGFRVELFEPEFDDEMWKAILVAERAGMKDGYFPPPYQARTALHIRGVMKLLKQLHPTVIVQGMFPEVAIATKILKIPSIGFGPIPSSPTWRAQHMRPHRVVTVDTDTSIQKERFDPTKSTLYRAATECGWIAEPPKDMSTLVHGVTERLVCDLESNYTQEEKAMCGSDTFFTGPIFAQSSSTHSEVACRDFMEDIERLLTRTDEHNKIFLTMASSGGKHYILEAVKALCQNLGEFRSIVVVPQNVCEIEDIQSQVESTCGGITGNGGSLGKNVIISDRIAPFDKIAPLVDVVVMHGGQGTVQSALAGGTPIVGVAMQFEQEFNLDNVERRGAGIHLKQKDWTAEKIRNAIIQVLKEPSFEKAAHAIQAEIMETDGPKNAANRILDFAEQHISQHD